LYLLYFSVFLYLKKGHIITGDNMDTKKLNNSLKILNEILKNYTPDKSIVFFDKPSQYFYLEKVCNGNNNAKAILDDIYSVIPLLLTDKSYDYFFDNIYELDIDKFEMISKAEFFDFALKNIDNWDYITRLCNDINKYLDKR